MSESGPSEQLSPSPQTLARLRAWLNWAGARYSWLSCRNYWILLLVFWATLVFATAGDVLSTTLAIRHQRDRVSAAAGIQAGRVAQLTDPAASLWLGPLAISLTAGLVFSVFLAWRVARPLMAHLNALRHLAAGDFTIRLSRPEGGSGQAEELARAFDGVAERLVHLDLRLREMAHALHPPLDRLDRTVAAVRWEGEFGPSAADRIAVEAARLRSLATSIPPRSPDDAASTHERGERCDIAELLKGVCDDARFEAQFRDVSVKLLLTSVTNDWGVMLAHGQDRERLRRAFETIVRNAVRFSPQGSTVLAWGKAEDKQVVFEVRDEGPGAPPEMVAALGWAIQGAPGGERRLGTGLSITRRTVLAHNGALEAINIGSGGLLIRVILPVSPKPVA